MEFYKIMHTKNGYHLEEENGQEGAPLNNRLLSILALELGNYHAMQDKTPNAFPLRFRKYMTVYHGNGTLEYVALTDGALLCDVAPIDGFAHTWLEGEGDLEEENRVWIGADGAVENRGPSTDAVRVVLESIIIALNRFLEDAGMDVDGSFALEDSPAE